MAIKKWKKVGKPETLAGGYGKRFLRQQFKDPTGEIHDFLLYTQPDSVVVMAMTTDRKVILVREYKQGSGRIQESLVGGLANKDEAPEETVHRELLEETGFRGGKIVPLGFVWIMPRHSPTRVNLFLALDCTRVGVQQLDHGEMIEIVLKPLDTWIADIVNGKICDTFGIAATMRALPYLNYNIFSHNHS